MGLGPLVNRLIWLPLLVFSSLLSAEEPARLVDPVTQLTLVRVPAGCFEMGNPNALTVRTSYRLQQLGVDNPGLADEAPVHEVCLDPFAMGVTEVTASQWQRVMGEPPPSGQGDQPAAGISWQLAQTFIRQLNRLSKDGALYRLPTEAEWEYACRAADEPAAPSEEYDQVPPGLPVRNGQALINIAWYSQKDYRIKEPSPVGKLAANAWGLQDMLGNVWEWTADSYSSDAYLKHPLRNPKVENEDSERVIRGGSFRSSFADVRCQNRSSYLHSSSLPQIGLRLVRSLQ